MSHLAAASPPGFGDLSSPAVGERVESGRLWPEHGMTNAKWPAAPTSSLGWPDEAAAGSPSPLGVGATAQLFDTFFSRSSASRGGSCIRRHPQRSVWAVQPKKPGSPGRKAGDPGAYSVSVMTRAERTVKALVLVIAKFCSAFQLTVIA